MQRDKGRETDKQTERDALRDKYTVLTGYGQVEDEDVHPGLSGLGQCDGQHDQTVADQDQGQEDVQEGDLLLLGEKGEYRVKHCG